MFEGKVIRPDAPSNILYGYFGGAMGFPQVELLAAGGVVQIVTGSSNLSYLKSNFDDPYDQEMVKIGIERYKKQHGDTLIEVLKNDFENAPGVIPNQDEILADVAEDVVESLQRRISQTWEDLLQKLKGNL